MGSTLRMMAGWPAGFLEAGAGAFIGPLWSINDKACLHVTQAFYGEAFNGSIPLGKVLKKIRARWVAEDNLTYPAYVLYGDPQATITFTKRTSHARASAARREGSALSRVSGGRSLH